MVYKDKHQNGQYIENNKGDLSYTEFVIQWAYDNNLELTNIVRYMPQAILDKIKSEALENNKLRPSVAKKLVSPSFDI